MADYFVACTYGALTFLPTRPVGRWGAISVGGMNEQTEGGLGSVSG